MSLKLKVLAAAFAFSFSFSATAAPRTYIAPAAERDAARAIADAYRGLSSKIPLELYDVDGLAESLDYDVATAADFVRDNIAYDPYLGVMRGPEGTISASAGSSWDQAVLLAALINSMAGEAMIVKGTLEKKDAERLLQVSFKDRAPLATGLMVEDVTEALKPFVPRSRLDEIIAEARDMEQNADENTLAADRDVSQLVKSLSASLATAGISIAQTDAAQTDRLVAQIAEEYVWVRYRNTPNDPWVDVHPAFQNAAAPKVEPEQFIAGTVPDDRLHKIEIRLEIERKTGDKLERISIMSPYSRPAANLALTQIDIGIAPDTVRSDGEAAYFIPIMNQAPAERGQAFTLQGLTASAEDVAAGPAIFATVGSKYGDALGGLDETTGKADTAPRLSGVILTVVHISPGGASTSTERRLTDFRQEMPESPSRLVSFHGVIDVDVGPENGARAIKDTLESAADFARILPYYKGIVEGKITPEDAASHPAFEADQSISSWTEMLTLGSIFNQNGKHDRWLVRTGPMVSMRRVQHVANTKGIMRQTIDIITDGTLSLAHTNGTVFVNPTGNFEQGIRTTIAEHALGSGPTTSDWRLRDVTAVLPDLASLKAWSDQANVSLLVRDRLNDDFEQGSVLVLLEHESTPLWWRIDTRTGQTLGMGPNGGEVTKEYAAFLKSASSAVTAFGIGYASYSCEASYPDNPSMRVCCLAGNLLIAAGAGKFVAAANANWASRITELGASGLAYLTGALGTEIVYGGIVGAAIPLPDYVCRAVLE
ncbi:hypothetical protein [Hyphomonas johnsonii]|uniref:Transglutaminase domain protein n=1 Tax=Hyphomonas johnsonii MHS-2 TaxID=1280950 RepID=A0A059FTU3_9PROT|nr:hypothetical protein [Hyphomonas johnsonii]KCZ94105.1 transglutaminase domain protein [Hyphomonas johnsonii MHS-2]